MPRIILRRNPLYLTTALRLTISAIAIVRLSLLNPELPSVLPDTGRYILRMIFP